MAKILTGQLTFVPPPPIPPIQALFEMNRESDCLACERQTFLLAHRR